MASLSARRFLLKLRCSVHKVTGSPIARLCYRPVPLCWNKTKSLTLVQVPKFALLCWGVEKTVFPAAGCQDAIPKQPAAGRQDQNSILKLQVHRLAYGLRLGLRAFVLMLKFGPLLLLYPLCLVSQRLNSLWLELLLRVTESCGPAFVKLGQWASTRRDLFSGEFCDKFSRLHGRVCPHAWAHTKNCLKRAFGDTWKKVFHFDSTEPVGSGCVAQVYRASINVDSVGDAGFRQLVEELEKEDLLEAWEIPGLAGSWGALWGKQAEDDNEGVGTEVGNPPDERPLIPDKSAQGYNEKEHLIPVAIKVLHPGIARQVQIDLLLMKLGSRLVGFLPGMKWLSLPEIVEEFEKLMTRQIDLRYEAKNIERFRENFQDVDYVKFPTPLRPFVTRNILVETFEESQPISSYLTQGVPGELKHRIARMGVETILKMVFVDNFVHGDLHPGNILVQEEKRCDPLGTAALTDLWDTVIVSVRPPLAPLHLVLLDAGIVAQLSEKDLQNFRSVFTAVVLGQGDRVAELILHHARASECRSVERFKQEMAELVNEARSNTVTLGKVQVGKLLSRVFKLLITHKVKLESNFASIVFAIMVLEGLGRSLDPDLDILEIAKPLLLKNSASTL
uniref:AarF domain containing kinase 2 n=1 Tax=Lepisosteus oculatus TaxID=7918 RepID=W5NIZ9_LEPOC|nr:PREDICTED: uncharacterized aarF domain-containing protein kinase 2 [Lepisosteus oculatus]